MTARKGSIGGSTISASDGMTPEKRVGRRRVLRSMTCSPGSGSHDHFAAGVERLQRFKNDLAGLLDLRRGHAAEKGDLFGQRFLGSLRKVAEQLVADGV